MAEDRKVQAFRLNADRLKGLKSKNSSTVDAPDWSPGQAATAQSSSSRNFRVFRVFRGEKFRFVFRFFPGQAKLPGTNGEG
jgi:hypothetical protein